MRPKRKWYRRRFFWQPQLVEVMGWGLLLILLGAFFSISLFRAGCLKCAPKSQIPNVEFEDLTPREPTGREP